jgi:cation:H+ antiporter
MYGIQANPIILTIIYGSGIIVSAILLSWAAEAAQIDISSSFAVAILALIAILPEYAVDLYFSFNAGSQPQFTHFAAANMTGSNRLLIGIGWSAVVISFVIGRKLNGEKVNAITLLPKMRVELFFLGIACLYSFVMPLFKKITLIDSIVLISLFFIYMFKVSSEKKGIPKLQGTAAGFKSLTKIQRFFSVNSLFLIATGLIFLAAKPFADSLIASGRVLHFNEYLLVQWLAPIATEAPELLVAIIYASRNKSNQAIGTLLSSKINQWTLLVGSIPIAYYLGGGGALGLPLDLRQNEEFILTAAQSILGFAFLIDLHFSIKEAAILLGLFLIQFFLTGTEQRLILSGFYILLGVILIIIRWKDIPLMFKSLIAKN